MTRLEEIEKTIEEGKELLKKYNDNVNTVTQIQMQLISKRDELIRELQCEADGHPVH